MNENTGTERITDEWANMMLDQATTDMFNEGIPITPKNFSAYFQEHYGLPWSVQEAEDWLKENGYEKKVAPPQSTLLNRGPLS